jgi:hypothetical protein
VVGAAAADRLGVRAGLGAAVDGRQHHAVPGLVEEGGRVRQVAAGVTEGVVAGQADGADQAGDALAELGRLAADQVELAAQVLGGLDLAGHRGQEVLPGVAAGQQPAPGAAGRAQAAGQDGHGDAEGQGRRQGGVDEEGQPLCRQRGHAGNLLRGQRGPGKAAAAIVQCGNFG